MHTRFCVSNLIVFSHSPGWAPFPISFARMDFGARFWMAAKRCMMHTQGTWLCFVQRWGSKIHSFSINSYQPSLAKNAYCSKSKIPAPGSLVVSHMLDQRSAPNMKTSVLSRISVPGLEEQKCTARNWLLSCSMHTGYWCPTTRIRISASLSLFTVCFPRSPTATLTGPCPPLPPCWCSTSWTCPYTRASPSSAQTCCCCSSTAWPSPRTCSSTWTRRRWCRARTGGCEWCQGVKTCWCQLRAMHFRSGVVTLV